VGVDARVDTPIKIMIDEKYIKDSPNTYEDWLDLNKIIIPCKKGKPDIGKWSREDLLITKEEWKNSHKGCEIALRLDHDVDLDIDNSIAKRFVDKYIKYCGAISGRPSNPTSHYWFKGQLDKTVFSLPKELEKYYENFPHGATLCEIRSGSKFYTIVPGSLHSKAHEYVRWEKYEGIKKYPGNLDLDLRKIALSTALCILYASKGSRDEYCTAIAGVLLSHTKWSVSDIDEFVYNIAVASNDDECEERKFKGTTGKKSKRKFGIPKLSELIGCTPPAVAHLFDWVGAKDSGSSDRKEITQECIGDVVEYGQDRYIIKVTGKLEGKIIKKEIIIDGPTLMNQKLFYDAVMSQASVWIPKMKVADFETIMMQKFESRTKSIHYVEEANKDLVFKKHFNHYIKQENAYSEKINLLEYKRPFFDMDKKSLEFNLDAFEDFLTDKRIKIARVDLVMLVQRVLKAIKNRGKVKVKENQYKSCVSWKIDNYHIDLEDLIVEGEYKEVVNTESIDFEQ
jgi:hypothetical protein